MNRIYQGRVSTAELLETEILKSLPVSSSELTDQSTSPLWKHHEVFQAAINYYLVALASLTRGPNLNHNRALIDLRRKIADSWAEFPRSTGLGAKPKSLRDSLLKWLKLNQTASLDDAFGVILEEQDASPEALQLALTLLLEKCGGESAIQQGGRGYFPRFCDESSKPTWDFSKEALASDLGKTRLADVLHAESTEDELQAIAQQLELSWTVKVSPGKFFTPEESKERLNEALQFLITKLSAKSRPARLEEELQKFTDPARTLTEALEQISHLGPSLKIPRNRKASKDLTFATLAFKYFPSPLTASLLKLSVAKPKARLEASENETDFTILGDDPIKLARGSRGFVFPAFTALPAWKPESKGTPQWKEFDIAAFKEALKSLNQFNQKTEERSQQKQQLEGQLAILLGGRLEGWKPAKDESGELTAAPDPLDPELFTLARHLEARLSTDLDDNLVGEEQTSTFGSATHSFRPGEWQVSGAALRGFRDIAEKWNQTHHKKNGAPAEEALVKIVKDYQSSEKNKKSIGSIPLLLTLCEIQYWPLWLDTKDDESPVNRFLYQLADFHNLLRDYRRSKEPINLTPAEPRHSRRLYMFSDVKDKLAKVKYTRHGDASSSLECAIAWHSPEGQFMPRRIRLDYSAPRLRRDHLQSAEASRWLQPMTKALGLKLPESEEAFDSAVSLMPDFAHSARSDQASNLRFLLNFPKTLDPAPIHQSLGKATIWNGQFNGIKGKNLHLHWPLTATPAAKKNLWSNNSKVLANGFTVLSTDLGQRTAGAWALLKTTPWDPRQKGNGTNRPVQLVGHDGTRTWFAEVLKTGMYRLPGEDQKIRDGSGGLSTEKAGKSGRSSDQSEWKTALDLAEKLLATSPKNWVGETHNSKSYPQQNDALIALANRRLSRLMTYHRWSCFDPDRDEVKDRKAKLIASLVEELSHWRAEEADLWKELVAQGDFASFRKATGDSYRNYRSALQGILVNLANRVLPLRDRSWLWQVRDGETSLYGELLDTGPPPATPPKIRGQRGLSMARLEQLDKLRTLFLRYNRSFDREPGKQAKFGVTDRGRDSGEPCPVILEKVTRMKEQRVNQTAHLILAQALGVQLSEHKIDPAERRKNDIHGEYEKAPNREPVDFIVIENLDRYLTSQGRAPSENSRLMKWSHRAVRDKLKMLAEDPFGIPVVEAPAAYSSRFCAKTSEAGARCEERNALDSYLQESLPKRTTGKAIQGRPHPDDWKALLSQFAELENHNKSRPPGKQRTLLLPKPGGPLFLGLMASNPVQADANAAINVGLRAIAAPESLHLIHKIRTQRRAGEIKTVKKNAREKIAFTNEPPVQLNGQPSAKLASATSPNFFYDGSGLSKFDQGKISLPQNDIPIASGVGLWATVNATIISRIVLINNQRLEKWGAQKIPITSTSNAQNDLEDIDPKDHIPM